jgi:hypothetical protein
MSDHSLAALDRIKKLAAICVAESEFIEGEGAGALYSATLLREAAQLLDKVAHDFKEAVNAPPRQIRMPRRVPVPRLALH